MCLPAWRSAQTLHLLLILTSQHCEAVRVDANPYPHILQIIPLWCCWRFFKCKGSVVKVDTRRVSWADGLWPLALENMSGCCSSNNTSSTWKCLKHSQCLVILFSAWKKVHISVNFPNLFILKFVITAVVGWNPKVLGENYSKKNLLFFLLCIK